MSPTQEWWTAAELAALALPEIPTTESGVLRFGVREGWRSRPREGRGGGREYHVSALPEAARAELARRALAEAGAGAAVLAVPGAEAVPAKRLRRRRGPAAASGRSITRRDARLMVLALLDRYRRATGLPLRRARPMFADLYNGAAGAAGAAGDRPACAVDVPDWVRAALPTVSASALADWAALRRRGQVDALGGAYGNRRGSGVIDRHPAVREFLAGGILQMPHLAIGELRDCLRAEFGEPMTVDGVAEPLALPSLRSLQRWVERWRRENHELVMLETDPDRWKSTYRVAVGDAAAGIERVNQLWEIDASPTDVLLIDGRYTLYVVIDVFSRRIAGHVTKTAASAGALMALRRAVVAWGLPETVRTDNGSDFVSRAFTQALALLEVEQDVAPPFSPERKAFVERVIGTINHSFMPLQMGFVGHSVADRKAIEARRAFSRRLGQGEREAFAVEVDRETLQARLDAWCETVYGRRPHGGLGGRTPFAIAQGCRVPRRTVEDDTLALLLAPAPAGSTDRPEGLRSVGREGIRVEGATFWHPDLRAHIREDVLVRLDPEDMGAVWVFSADHSRFVCRATNIERAGVDRQEMTAKAKAAEKAHVAELRAEARRAKRQFAPHKVADAIIEQSRRQADGVVPFPAPAGGADTPALDAVARAVAGRAEVTVPLRRDDVDPETHRKFVAQVRAEQGRIVETKEQRFVRWQELDRRIAAGEPVSDDETNWHAVYRTTAECRALIDLVEEFGDGFLRPAAAG